MNAYILVFWAAGLAPSAAMPWAWWLPVWRAIGFPWGTTTRQHPRLLCHGSSDRLAGAPIGRRSRSPAVLATGFLGGFTTFSAFSLDAVTLYERGALTAAAGYVIASVAVSILALFAGLWLARQL
jgi:CrcB protein